MGININFKELFFTTLHRVKPAEPTLLIWTFLMESFRATPAEPASGKIKMKLCFNLFNPGRVK